MSDSFIVPIAGPLQARVTVHADAADALFKAMGARVQAPQPFFRAVGHAARGFFADRFREGGLPPWAPLAESTVRERARLIKAGAFPPRTKAGKVPARLLQRDASTGQLTFGATTILIRRGTLRDSWCVKGARGNVEEIGADEALFGSQLTIERTTTPEKYRPHYMVVTLKAQAALAKGKGAAVGVPLALLHEGGTSRMPQRSVVAEHGLSEAEIGQVAEMLARFIVTGEA